MFATILISVLVYTHVLVYSVQHFYKLKPIEVASKFSQNNKGLKPGLKAHICYCALEN